MSAITNENAAEKARRAQAVQLSQQANLFRTLAPTLWWRGWPILPIMPGEKRPALQSWQLWADKLADSSDLEHWCSSTVSVGAGIGLVMGQNGDFDGDPATNLFAVDDDTDQTKGTELSQIFAALADKHFGPTRFVREGRNGRPMRLYRLPIGVTFPRFHIKSADNRDGLELIGHGGQIVAFHVHPDTLKPYAWPDLSPINAGLDQVPMVTLDAIKAFAAEAAALPGWVIRKGGELIGVERPSATVYGFPNGEVIRTGERGNASGVWSDLNTAALGNLDKWVPVLDGLEGLKKTGEGYAAVATHVQTKVTSGERGKALSFHPRGIKDHGSRQQGYTPLDIVKMYRGTGTFDSASWLAGKIGFSLRERLDALPKAADPADEALVGGLKFGNKAKVAPTPDSPLQTFTQALAGTTVAPNGLSLLPPHGQRKVAVVECRAPCGARAHWSVPDHARIALRDSTTRALFAVNKGIGSAVEYLFETFELFFESWHNEKYHGANIFVAGSPKAYAASSIANKIGTERVRAGVFETYEIRGYTPGLPINEARALANQLIGDEIDTAFAWREGSYDLDEQERWQFRVENLPYHEQLLATRLAAMKADPNDKTKREYATTLATVRRFKDVRKPKPIPAPRTLVQVGVGIGKTTAAVQHIARQIVAEGIAGRWIGTDKQFGFSSPFAGLGTIVFALPTHEKAGEVMRDLGLEIVRLLVEEHSQDEESATADADRMMMIWKSRQVLYEESDDPEDPNIERLKVGSLMLKLGRGTFRNFNRDSAGNVFDAWGTEEYTEQIEKFESKSSTPAVLFMASATMFFELKQFEKLNIRLTVVDEGHADKMFLDPRALPLQILATWLPNFAEERMAATRRTGAVWRLMKEGRMSFEIAGDLVRDYPEYLEQQVAIDAEDIRRVRETWHKLSPALVATRDYVLMPDVLKVVERYELTLAAEAMGRIDDRVFASHGLHLTSSDGLIEKALQENFRDQVEIVKRRLILEELATAGAGAVGRLWRDEVAVTDDRGAPDEDAPAPEPGACIVVAPVTSVSRQFAERPVLYLDATPPGDEVLRTAWGSDFKRLPPITARDGDGVTSEFIYVPDMTKYGLANRAGKLSPLGRRIAYDIAATSAKMVEGESALWIVPQNLEAALREEYPDLFEEGRIEVAHHGNIAGLNRWEDVRYLTVIYGNLPPRVGLERYAGRVTGEGLADVLYSVPYETQLAPQMTTAGRAVDLPQSWHEVPFVRAMLEGSLNADIVQAVGRCRAVNRTSDDPVHIRVLSPSAVTGLAVVEVLELSEDFGPGVWRHWSGHGVATATISAAEGDKSILKDERAAGGWHGFASDFAPTSEPSGLMLTDFKNGVNRGMALMKADADVTALFPEAEIITTTPVSHQPKPFDRQTIPAPVPKLVTADDIRQKIEDIISRENGGNPPVENDFQ